MDDWVTILSAVVIAIIGSGSTTAIVNHLLSKSKPDPMRDGVRLLMQDKIEYLATKYCSAGEITWQQKKYLLNAYQAYKGMGGNGDIEQLMKDINSLKVRYN